MIGSASQSAPLSEAMKRRIEDRIAWLRAADPRDVDNGQFAAVRRTIYALEWVLREAEYLQAENAKEVTT